MTCRSETGAANDDMRAFLLNPRSRILRNGADVENYLSSTGFMAKDKDAKIAKNFIENIKTLDFGGIDVIVGFYYEEIFEVMSASDFEQLLIEMGWSLPSFLNGRGYRCVYSERLGHNICDPTRGYSCSSFCERSGQ